jgi:hypothetical protein
MSHAFDRAQLQAVVAAVLDLHRALLAIEERDYLARNGLDERPPGLLHIVMSHPQFAYLRTLSTLAAELDSRLELKPDDPAPEQPAEAVIDAALAEPTFRARLNARIQDSPDVAGAYATVKRTIAELAA